MRQEMVGGLTVDEWCDYWEGDQYKGDQIVTADDCLPDLRAAVREIRRMRSVLVEHGKLDLLLDDEELDKRMTGAEVDALIDKHVESDRRVTALARELAQQST